MSKLREDHLAYLRESINNINYGSISITIHNGEITQIDTTNKRRFTKNGTKIHS